jgi:hypothetical protein
MALNSVSGGNFNTPLLVGDPVVVPGGSYPPQFTTVGGVRIPSAFEVQSDSGAFLGPRMTGAQMNALTPLVPGMEVYVTDSATVAEGKYIRGATTWNLVVGSGTVNNVIVSDVDPEPQFAVPVWSGTTNELMSTTVLIENSNQLLGVSYIQGVLNPPNNFPIYGINPSNVFVSTEGMGSTGVGTLNFSASGAVQAEVTGTANTGNILRFTGSTSGNPPSMSAVGVDGNISIYLAPKGTGQVRNNVGASSLPSYSFTGRTGDGMYSISNGTLGFSAQGLRQVEIFGTGDGSNFLVFSGSATGQPVGMSATGSDTDVSLAIGTKGAGQILTDSDGSAAAPIYSFRANPTDGIYSVSSGTMGFATGGVLQAVISPIGAGDGTNFMGLTGSISGGAPAIIATGSDTDVNMALAAQGAGVFLFTSTTAVNSAVISPSGTGEPVVIAAVGGDTDVSLLLLPSGAGQVQNGVNGTQTAPAYSFSSSPGDGMYSLAPGNLGFAAGGAFQAGVTNVGDGTNFLVFGGGATGQPVIIATAGADSDVSLELNTRGRGNVFLNSSSANLGIGITTFDSNSSNNISIANGSAPLASVTGTIQMYSSELSPGNNTLSLWTEGTPVSATVSAVPTQNISVVINGTTYYLMAKTIV